MNDAMDREYDVLVIGGGPAGENAAARAAAGGLRVSLVERDLLGGECTYWGCMPSKALLRPGEAVAAARRAPGAAAAITGEIDVAAVLDRRDRLAAHWDDAGHVSWAEKAGLKILRGHGRITGERRVAVEAADGSTVHFEAQRAVVIATGTVAAWPPIPGLVEACVWDNRAATSAKDIPRRLVVIGGGVVGCELAQAWRSLGSEEVTIVEAQERLIPGEEPFASAELRAALERLGVTVLAGNTVVAVERTVPDGPVAVSLTEGKRISADEVIVAVGRRPLTDDIGLETVGLEPGQYLEVDDSMRSTDVAGGWLYVVGDANGRALLTHTGKYQARVAGDHIAGRTESVSGRSDVTATPRVVFTDPNIAAVGLTEAAALEKGLEVRAVDYELGHVAGSAASGRGIRGTCRIVVDENRRVLVGATFVGPGTAEMLHAATIAIVAEVPLETLWHAIPAFPTQSEIWLRLLETYGL